MQHIGTTNSNHLAIGRFLLKYGWGHGGGQEGFCQIELYKKFRKQRKVPDFLRNQELFGGDYWTRTSDLLRVKQAL